MSISITIEKVNRTWRAESYVPIPGGRVAQVVTTKAFRFAVMTTFVVGVQDGSAFVTEQYRDFAACIFCETHLRATEDIVADQHAKAIAQIDQWVLRADQYYTRQGEQQ